VYFVVCISNDMIASTSGGGMLDQIRQGVALKKSAVAPPKQDDALPDVTNMDAGLSTHLCFIKCYELLILIQCCVP
jgi:hypothetical protein